MGILAEMRGLPDCLKLEDPDDVRNVPRPKVPSRTRQSRAESHQNTL